MSLRIGVDVGGTNTDACLIRGDSILGWHKATTSPDTFQGIKEAIQSALTAAKVGRYINVSIGAYYYKVPFGDQRIFGIIGFLILS